MSRYFDNTPSLYAGFSAIPGSGQLTMACWAFQPSVVLDRLMSVGDELGRANAMLHSEFTDELSFSAASVTDKCTTTNLVPTSQWYHAAGRIVSDVDRSVFLNGGTTAGDRGDATISDIATFQSTRLVLGAVSSGSTTNALTGYLAHAAVWDAALTDEEISALGASRISPLLIRPSNLCFYAPLHGAHDGDVIGGLLPTGSAVADDLEPPQLWLPRQRKIFLPNPTPYAALESHDAKAEQFPGTTRYLNLAVPTGTNRKAVLIYSTEGVATQFVSATFNANAMTVAADNDGSNVTGTIAYYDIPDALAAGSYQIAYVVSQNGKSSASAVCLSNVAAGAPEATDFNAATGLAYCAGNGMSVSKGAFIVAVAGNQSENADFGAWSAPLRETNALDNPGDTYSIATGVAPAAGIVTPYVPVSGTTQLEGWMVAASFAPALAAAAPTSVQHLHHTVLNANLGTWTFTALPTGAGNARRLLVVREASTSSASPLVNTVTFGGVNVTAHFEQVLWINNDTRDSIAWILREEHFPTVPSADLVISFLGSRGRILSADIFANVDQEHPVDVVLETAGVAATSASAPFTLLDGEVGMFVHSQVQDLANTDVTVGDAAFTEQYDEFRSTQSRGVLGITSTAGQRDPALSWTNPVDYSLGVLTIRPHVDLPLPAEAPEIEWDTPTMGRADAATSLTFDHYVQPGRDRLLLLNVYTAGGNSITAVTVNGVAASLAHSYSLVGSARRIYTVAMPAVGANTIVVTMNGTSTIRCAAISLRNVDQDAPLGAVTDAFDNTDPQVRTVATDAGDLAMLILNDSAAMVWQPADWGRDSIILNSFGGASYYGNAVAVSRAVGTSTTVGMDRISTSSNSAQVAWFAIKKSTATLNTFLKGFNFRATAGYVTDGENETYVTGGYPANRNGVSFGWELMPPDFIRDRTTASPNTPKLSGVHQFSSSQDDLQAAEFRVDLPAPGQYRVKLAAGDANFGNRSFWEICDGTRVIARRGNTYVNANNFVDAIGELHTTPQNWLDNNSTLSLTFTTNTMRLRLKRPTANSTVLAHLEVERVTALSVVYSDSDTRWNILNYIQNPLDLRWSLSGFVSDTVTFDWDLDLPVVERTSSVWTTNVTDHAVQLPSTINAGELLIIGFAAHDDFLYSAHPTPSGWTQLGSQNLNGYIQHTVYAKVADGTEGGTSVTITTAEAQSGSAHAFRITRFNGNIATDIDAFVRTTYNSSVGYLAATATAGWGVGRNLYLNLHGSSDDNGAITAWPADGYHSPLETRCAAGTNNSCNISSQWKFKIGTGSDTDSPTTYYTYDQGEAHVDWTIIINTTPYITRRWPLTILANTNLSGVVSYIQDDPESPDSDWLTIIN